MSRSAFTALLLSCVLLALSMPARADDLPYRFGLGKADITGEAAEVGMMGYSSLEQKTAGIHMRQWARAFVIEEAASGRRLVYVNTDLGMIFQAVHLNVLARLKAKYPGVYDENNVMLAATHTHSGPAASPTTRCTTCRCSASRKRPSTPSSTASSAPSSGPRPGCSPAACSTAAASCATPAATARCCRT